MPRAKSEFQPRSRSLRRNFLCIRAAGTSRPHAPGAAAPRAERRPRAQMRVAIDIRCAGDFGHGTYIRNIVNQFARSDRETEYLLICQKSHLEQFDPFPE